MNCLSLMKINMKWWRLQRFQLQHCQRGSAVVEFALLMPLLLFLAFAGTDLFRVSHARAEQEQVANTLASVLTQQSTWTAPGLDALLAHLLPDDRSYEVVISRVQLDRELVWYPLSLGNTTELCPRYGGDGGLYTASLPEEANIGGDGDNSNGDEDQRHQVSLLVVQLCRQSDDLNLLTGLLNSKLMQSISIQRMAHQRIELDDTLNEALVKEDDERDGA